MLLGPVYSHKNLVWYVLICKIVGLWPKTRVAHVYGHCTLHRLPKIQLILIHQPPVYLQQVNNVIWPVSGSIFSFHFYKSHLVSKWLASYFLSWRSFSGTENHPIMQSSKMKETDRSRWLKSSLLILSHKWR